MRINVHGKQVEPAGFVLLMLFIWVFVTVAMVWMVLVVVAGALVTIFRLPAALLQRKGAR